MRFFKKHRSLLGAAAALFVFSELLFLVNIQFPREQNFDEFHYVPAAREILHFTKHEKPEHPPLGKYLIAAGMALGGDKPFGWRVMSTLFGALSVVGMFFWAWVLFRDFQISIAVALLSVFNQFLYVQARIAMLDTFMMAFLIWASVCFCAAWRVQASVITKRRLFIGTGVFVGLALATKWFTVAHWGLILLLLGTIRVFQAWQVRFKTATDDDWYSPELFKGVGKRFSLFALILVPLGVYFLSFVPIFFLKEENLKILGLLPLQLEMASLLKSVAGTHPYASQWYEWPLILRPMWYSFAKEGESDEWVRGVFLVGNPLIMWAGLAAVFFCFKNWIETKSREGFLIFFFYSLPLIAWAILPRPVAFYYYYYPCAMVLSLAIGFFFWKVKRPKALWSFLFFSGVMFAYFFPVLSALKIPSRSFFWWMWFTSWI